MTDYDEDDSDQSDDEEPILDIVKQDTMKELELQKNEFRLAIVSLTNKFYSINTSEENDNYNELRHTHQQLQRELKRWEIHLPIYSKRTEIIELIRKNQILILKADTGSGKSTQMVQYLCDEGFADEKQILCTQPRKLAACSLAARVAEEYGCRVGEEVGTKLESESD
ncbi:unnamed protein product [Rotaria sp. Silwood1]|nr:unnamed protein product [Rotaria sp. Silwood1]